MKDKDRKRNREKRKLARERLRRLRALVKNRQLQAEKERAREDRPADLPLAMARPDRRVMPREPSTESQERQKQRQIEIQALERDVAELSRLSDPSDATAADIGRIRREVEGLNGIFMCI